MNDSPCQNWLFSLCHLSDDDDIKTVTLSRGASIEGRGKVCLVRKGAIQVLSRSRDGHEILINTLGEGNLFGIHDLFLDEGKRTTTLRSTKCTSLAVVDKETIRSALRRDAEAMEAYARFCNDRLQFLLERIEALTPHSARHRLMEYLLRSSDGKGTVVLQSKEALRKELGIGRSSLFRELSYLSRRNLVLGEENKRLLVDVEALREALVDEEEKEL